MARKRHAKDFLMTEKVTGLCAISGMTVLSLFLPNAERDHPLSAIVCLSV